MGERSASMLHLVCETRARWYCHTAVHAHTLRMYCDQFFVCNCIDKSEYLLLSHFNNNYWLRLFIVFLCAAFDSESHTVPGR